MKKTIFALVSNETQADRIVNRLLDSGFLRENVSILFPDRDNRTRRNELQERGRNELPERGRNELQGRGRNELQERANREDFDDEETPTMERSTRRGKIPTEKHSKAPEGGVAGALTGGVLGGSLGLLAGLGSLAIPGLGPFIAAGPLLAALSGSAVGGSVGLLLGALIGYGIPEYEAKKYETALREGKILLSVQTDSDEEAKRAQDIMKTEGATDISISREKARSY